MAGMNVKMGHQHVFMCFLLIMIGYMQRVNISIAIIPMTNKMNQRDCFPTYSWNEKEKASILSSFFWGYIWPQIGAGKLAEKIGPKLPLTVSMFICSSLNLVTPVLVSQNYLVLCAIRVVQGLAQGSIYPSCTVVISNWILPSGRTRAAAFAYSGRHVGTVCCLILSGFLASYFGWPSIFYVTGSLGYIWCIVWVLIGANNPADYERSFFGNSSINFDEDDNKAMYFKTPWKEILTSPPVWAISIVHFGCEWGFWTLFTQLPSFMSSVYNIDIENNGILTALPVCFGFISIVALPKLDFSLLSQRTSMSKTTRRILWDLIALWGGGILFLYLASNVVLSVFSTILVISLFMILFGGVYCGHFTCHADLSTNFCGTLMGIMNSFGNISSFLAPLSVGWIVTDSSQASEWKNVFLVSAAIMFSTNVIYMIFGSSETQPWNIPTESTIYIRSKSYSNTIKTSKQSNISIG